MLIQPQLPAWLKLISGPETLDYIKSTVAVKSWTILELSFRRQDSWECVYVVGPG